MPNNKSDYFIYTHNDPGISTLGSFVSNSNSIGIGLSILDLLNYEDENGLINLDNLTDLYTADELIKFNSLIQQAQGANQKTQASQTSEVNSTTGGNSIPVEVTTTVQPDTLITLKSSKTSQLQTLNNQLSLYVNNQLNPKQQYWINLLPKPEVRQLFTLFIFRVLNATGYTVDINRSFQLFETVNGVQMTTDQMLRNFENGNTPHNEYLALDITLSKRDGTYVGSGGLNKNNIPLLKGVQDPSLVSISLSDWNNTKVPDIAKELGLRWGGNAFTNLYDPVHFDAVPYYTVGAGYFRALVANQSSTTPPSNSNSLASTVVEEPTQADLNSIYGDLPLHVGTILNIPLVKIDREILLTQPNAVVNTPTFNAFLAKQLFRLLNDEAYKPVSVYKSKTVSLGDVKNFFPYLSVWIWSRAASLQPDGTFNHIIYNVTPYVGGLNISNAENGGSFSIDIAPIAAEIINNQWFPSSGSQQVLPTATSDYVNQSFLHYLDDNNLKRSSFFFEKNFQQNDLVFIRFEKLVLEKSYQNLDDVATIPISALPGKIFDMIGLIDTTSISTQIPNVSINISGRDLVKTVIEDGVYFYPFDFISGGIFANTGAANFKLARFNGQILTRFQNLNRNIERSMEYIFNALSTIDICPTDLFDPYGTVKDFASDNTYDTRSKAYQLDHATEQEIQDQQRQIDSDKQDIIQKIVQIRKSNNVTQSDEVTTYNIIESFLQSVINDNSITYDQATSTITAWTEVINNVKLLNQSPSTLGDLLFIRNRAWVDNQNRKILDSQSLSIINDIETLATEINPQELRITPLIIGQLSRVLQDPPNMVPSNTGLYPAGQIISTTQAVVTAAQISDSGLMYGSIESINLLNALTVTLNSFSTQLSKLDTNYTALRQVKNLLYVAGGAPIYLMVVEKTITDMQGDIMNIFNRVYSNIIQRQQLSSKQSTTPQLLPVKGIWQIIKLVIDDSVKNRLLADASIGNEMGSLINAIRKICQEPFCEFFTDTYGDQFYFIVRKKPFDSKSITSFLKRQIVSEATAVIETNRLTGKNTNAPNTAVPLDSSNIGQNFNTKTNNGIPTINNFTSQDITITIDELDVISDSLTTSQEAYSWYRLQLRNLMSGNDSDMAFAYLKAVFFPEYADIFGSKPFDIFTNYIPLSSVVDKNGSVQTSYFIRQAIYDLKYMIESSAYLPFTRQGTITINGDRRIKRGTWVRLASTNEIFYVNSVSNSFGITDQFIDRTTTLNVSRGMIEKYVREVTKPDPNFISYFNIINLPVDESVFVNQGKRYTTVDQVILSKWKVNLTVFNFFIQKLQFNKNSSEVSLPYTNV